MKQKQAIATSVVFVLVCLFNSGVPDASAHEAGKLGRMKFNLAGKWNRLCGDIQRS